MKIQIRIRDCVFQIPVPFPLCKPMKQRIFKANRRAALVRRTKLIVETDRLSRFVGYNMHAPFLVGGETFGALCYHCKASIGARLRCHVCGTSNELVKPAWIGSWST